MPVVPILLSKYLKLSIPPFEPFILLTNELRSSTLLFLLALELLTLTLEELQPLLLDLMLLCEMCQLGFDLMQLTA